MSSSSSTPSAGTSTTPRRSNSHATAPERAEVAVVLREDVAHLGGGAVPVVGQRLDDHRDAARGRSPRRRSSRTRPRRSRCPRPSRSRGRCCPSASSAARAFSIGVLEREVRRPGRGPPSRAATMIARVSFEKSLPRFASAAPFLCLIDDHLLCPDTGVSPPARCSRNSSWTRVSSVSSGWNAATRSRPSRASTAWPSTSASTSTSGPGILEPRRADEDRAQRLVAVADVEVRLEAVHLAAERVALGRASRRAPRWSRSRTIIPAHVPKIGAVELAHRLVEAVEAHEARDRRRLAARDDEPVEPGELLGQAHLDRLGAEPPQHVGVLAEVPLHGEDADL